MTFLFFLLVALVAVAVVSALAARGSRRRSGLPTGELLYGDTGFAVGKLSPTEKGREGVKQEKPLVSEAYGLKGRPDYLVRVDRGIVPVEVKSTKRPASGAYDSHIMQLAAYCLLVEEVTGASVPYGIIRYADAEVLIDYTPELRDELIELLYEMDEAREAMDVHRSHGDARRCSRCSMREICEEALA
jgi:CRISPR-associated exonuclease Cas4